jgi:LacI family transcriptional regulator
VPRDCSIIGFDDIELGRFTYPALSTVGQSVRALGDMAAQTLIERIAGKSSANARPAGRRRVVTPRLIVRESTSAWAGAGKRDLAA